MQSIDEYMQDRLFHSDSGFYETQKISNHFVTPSVLKSSYHKYLTDWIVQQGFENILEFGSGSGSLAESLAPSMQTYTIVEKSAFQQNEQKKNCNYLHMHWVQSFPEQFSGLVIVQEVLDCLPTKMVHIEDNFYTQWQIHNNQAHLNFFEPTDFIVNYVSLLRQYQSFDIKSFPDPTAGCMFLENIYTQLSEGSCVLLIDYGAIWPYFGAKMTKKCPLRGFFQHRLIENPWESPDPLDVTYDIDFSFLALEWEKLGGEVLWTMPFAEFLIQHLKWLEINPLSQDKMLFDPRLMGSSFLVMLMQK